MKPFYFCLIFLLNLSCAASRKPIPIGIVPPAKRSSITDEQYGHQILTALTEKYPLDYNHPRATEVYSVVDRLTKAAGAGADPWHVYIFRDPQFKNAAATRGNHVFIWTGLLDSTKSEAELAAILAHEISHVLAGHTDPDPNEEIRKLFIGLGSLAAGIAVSTVAGNPTIGDSLGRITAGATQELASGFLLYPYSRDNELEADRIGLLLMAQAKYDPQAAIDFWTRAENDPNFTASIAFFSTHPPAKDRLGKLKEVLPLALKKYNDSSGIEKAVPYVTQNDQSQKRTAITFEAKQNFLKQRDDSDFAFNNIWQLEATKAVLFQRPDLKSLKLGEFSKGALLEVTNEGADWLEISKPDRGYVQKELFKKNSD